MADKKDAPKTTAKTSVKKEQPVLSPEAQRQQVLVERREALRKANRIETV